MHIYDGTSDKKTFPTNHTIAVVSANRVVCGKKDSMTIRKNGREDWSLFFCEQGRLYFDDSVLEAGKIWIYPPYSPQKYVAYSKDDVIYYYLHFTGSDVYELLASLDIKTHTKINSQSSLVLKRFDKIITAMLDDSAFSSLTAEYNTLYLISQIVNKKRQVNQAGVIKRVIDDMEHSVAKKYSPSYYAEMMNLSVSRFNHLFKEQTGMSPYNYLSGLRVDNAATLLEQTDMKIKDIAQQCGYEDPLYFTQAFKREKGVTPSQYRKLNSLKTKESATQD